MYCFVYFVSLLCTVYRLKQSISENVYRKTDQIYTDVILKVQLTNKAHTEY